MKVYIACSLTHVPREHFADYVKFIHKIAEEITECNSKYALVNSDPQLGEFEEEQKAKLCYLWDRNMVEEANLVIAEASYPSIGLGIELQIAENKNIPVILIFKDVNKNKAEAISYSNPDSNQYNLQIGEGFVSLMALGLPNICKVIKYEEERQCIININKEIAKHRKIKKNDVLYDKTTN